MARREVSNEVIKCPQCGQYKEPEEFDDKRNRCYDCITYYGDNIIIDEAANISKDTWNKILNKTKGDK